MVAGRLFVVAYGWFIARPAFLTRGMQDRIVRRLQMASSADGAYADLAQARQWISADPWDVDLPLTLARVALEGGRDADVTAEQRAAFIELAKSYVQVARRRSSGR